MDPVLSKARWLLCSAIISLSFGPAEATAMAGVMTMWSLNSDVIVGSNIAHEGGPSACNFANPEDGGLNSPAAQSPYIKNRRYCAANIKTLFQGGQACGKCYQIFYSGYGGGRAGSTVIQVVNSGHMAHGAVFDCHIDAFQTITGASTGAATITYREVYCDTSEGGGRATLLSDANAWWGKFVFSNLARPPVRVALVGNDGEHQLAMDSCCGTWSGSVGRQYGPVGFRLTYSDGSMSSINNCFTGYGMQRRSASCQQFPVVPSFQQQFPVVPSFQQSPVDQSSENCMNSFGEGRDSCSKSDYAVCEGFRAGVSWGQCKPALVDPSKPNCDGNFGSGAANACQDPRYRACIGHQAGSSWGKCLQLLPFDPNGVGCNGNWNTSSKFACKNPEYPRCVGFWVNLTWGKCRQPASDPGFGDCGGDSHCNSKYPKCVGFIPGVAWGSCIEGASAVLPSVVTPLGLAHQSQMMAMVSCTLPAFIILGLVAMRRSRRATSHLPEVSGLMDE